VSDCNQELCAVAKRNLTLSVCLQSYLVVWKMIASLGSVWLKKLKCVIAKTAGLFLWLQKRKRKTEPVFDCNYLA
jgi:hypothetical protein